MEGYWRGVVDVGAMTDTELVDEMLRDLEKDSPNLRAVMLSAIKNVSPTHLLDPRLLTAKLDEAKGPRRLPVLSDS